MHDGQSAPPAAAGESTFLVLRADFLEDGADDLKALLSYLNEASTGARPVGEVMKEARRVAVTLVGGASGFDLPLLGVAAQRFDDYVASLSSEGAEGLADIATYCEMLLDLLAEPEGNEETAAQLMRRLPAKGGGFEAEQVEVREIEVILVMEPGILTRIVEREMLECGYRVTTVPNSFKALELACRTLPDLIIASAVLPDLDGIDLCNALKAMPATRNFGIALITGLDRDDVRLKQLPEGVPIIHKSASFGDDLVQALQDQFLL